MSFKKRVPASLAFSLAICTGPATAHAADDGLITKPSKYSVEETVARFEAAVKQKEAAGFTVFTEIDHAAAAKKFGLDMRPRIVIVFGNPKLGTPSMVKTPLLAIDVPPKDTSNQPTPPTADDQLVVTIDADDAIGINKEPVRMDPAVLPTQ